MSRVSGTARPPRPARVRHAARGLAAIALLLVAAQALSARQAVPRPGLLRGAAGAQDEPDASVSTPLADYARALVDHPALADADVDAAVHAWLDAVEAEPEHPLTLAALVRVEQVRALLDDPAEVDARLLALEPDDRWSPRALRELTLSRGRARVRRAAAADLARDAFEGFLSAFHELAPLPPRSPLAWRDGDPRMSDPGFGETHESLHGDPVRWTPLTRTHVSPAVTPGADRRDRSGWGLLAAQFDVRDGGAAWVEVTVFDAVNDPSFAFAVNDETPVPVDHLSIERRDTLAHPVVLREGRNRVTLFTRLGSIASYGVRVLDEHGLPHPGLTEVVDLDGAPLGPVPEGALRPGRGPPTPSRALREQASDSPDAIALRGLLAIDRGLDAEGLSLVRAAADLAPDRAGLRALAIPLVENAPHLPETWRRNAARELAEQTRGHFVADVYLAALAAIEDEELEAIAAFEELSERFPAQVQTLLELERLFGSLGMEVEAERALDRAVGRAPLHPAVLWRAADAANDRGRVDEVVAFAERAVDAGGRSPTALRRLAAARRAVGDVDGAESALRDALRRDRHRDVLPLARLLVELDRWDEADALLAGLSQRAPDSPRPPLERAGLAVARGDTAGEIAHLREVLRRVPSHEEARDRLAALTGEGRDAELVARYRLDGARVLAEYDEDGRDDSVVRVLDHAVVRIFPDGAIETLTHDIWQVRDLAAIEAMGTRRVPGEVLRVATIKGPRGSAEQPEGAVYEPVRVAGEYVMPNLEPGDFVETVFRILEPPPPGGVVDAGRWTFANEEMPFDVSHYVVIVPKSLPLRLEQANFDGVHEVHDEGEDAVHVFRVEDQPVVPPEPKAPPRSWYLPWVELGMDEDVGAVAAMLHAETLRASRVTPELVVAADAVTRGRGDQTAQARALYRLVADQVDERADFPVDATHVLLSRKGNATMLYAALLRAAGIEHEVIWSRAISPEADGDPDPAFVRGGWYVRKPYVVVRPEGGEVVWCDLSSRELPYGVTTGDAPRSPVLIPSSGRVMRTAAAPGAQDPGVLYDIDLELDTAGGARVSATAEFLGSSGFVLKEPIRAIPEAQRRFLAAMIAANAIPGLDVRDVRVENLDDRERPLWGEITGDAPGFVDRDGRCPLPMMRLDLVARYASEGPRRLPVLEPDRLLDETRVRISPAAGTEAVELPESVLFEFDDALYALSIEETESGDVVARRRVHLPPFSIDAAEYPRWLEFCRAIDDAEARRLRFGPEASADVDPADPGR